MALFNWSDRYSVSVSEMDTQHKKLFDILNQLYDAMSQNKANDVLAKVLGELVTYTKFHFAAEERYMQRYGYPKYDQQKREHDQFIAKIQEFQNDLNAGKLALSINISTFLKNWLTNHISVIDKEYGPFFNEKGLK